jgi:hypothetical protein
MSVAGVARRAAPPRGRLVKPGSAPLKHPSGAKRASAAAPLPSPASRSRLGDVVAVLRVLCAGPVTPRDLAERAGVSEQSVYRLLATLRAEGAPIESGEIAADAGRPAATYRLTLRGLSDWLGPR